MTYLLTEVSLGILGYQFYDIDGVPGSPNLSEGLNLPCEEGEYKNRPHLTELMQLDLENSGNPDNLNERVVEPSIATNNAAEDQRSSTSKQQNPEAGVSSTLCDTREKQLNKLLNYGRAKLREQVRRRISEFGEKHLPMGMANEHLLDEFMQQEQNRLKREVEVMMEFRKVTERTFKALDKDLYEKYTATFKKIDEKAASAALSKNTTSEE